MGLTATLRQRWQGKNYPFIVGENIELSIDDVLSRDTSHLSQVNPGDVVALIGDFDPQSISDLFWLIDRGAVIVPLTMETLHDHEYFFESSLVDWVVQFGSIYKREHENSSPLLEELRKRSHPGLVLFSTGTTGRPKAILHDLEFFLQRFETPRPTLRTLGFLLFDHIGGLNTLLHTVFNSGVVVTTKDRSINNVLSTCAEYSVEALPTTPTFLRMMLISGAVPDQIPNCLRIITYGTERMDQPTLTQLCSLLPNTDFRQTFGMSELGIVRAKSKSRDSLFMRIGGEGVETRIVESVLHIRSESRMIGYLNAPSPFDSEGWYDTGDVVEESNGYIKVVGRTNEIINVGGLKFMASEVERVALEFPGIELVKVEARANPVTGQHVELQIQPQKNYLVDLPALRTFLSQKLPSHMQPRRIKLEKVTVGHRFKRI
jgi:acyl-CoA synthetase (AMP-forming)/AMP-acid ligase II